jgi:glycosyltransferase involved in cell wall biosynthesis
VTAALVRDQVTRGWDVWVACPAGGELADAVAAGGGHWLPWPATRAPGPAVPLEVLRLHRLARAVRPDLVHLHSAKAGLVGRLAFRGRVPTVFQPHAWSFLAVRGTAAALARRWERAGARWADVVAVVSDEERCTGERAGVRARWELLPNGVDLGRRPAPGDRDASRRVLAQPQVPLAVCVGRLCRQKGQDVLLEAWPRVRTGVPEARLVLVGDGPDRPALQRARPDGVELVGDVADAGEWLRAADVVVLPSRWEAGLSLVAMEAMALGRSVVASRVAGTTDGLGAGAGAVVEIDDAPALAAAVLERLRDPGLAAREGAAGRRWVEEHHDLHRTTARAADLYLRLRR